MFRALVFALGFTWALVFPGAASAATPDVRVIFVQTVSVDRQPDAPKRVRKAVASRLKAAGVELLPEQRELSKCRTLDCLARARKKTGATHVAVLNVVYSAGDHFNIDIVALDTNDGHEATSKKATCDLVCDWPGMYEKLDQVVGEAMSDLIGGRAGSAIPVVVVAPKPATTPSETKDHAARTSEPSTAADLVPASQGTASQGSTNVATQMPRDNVDKPEAGHTRSWVLIGAGTALAAGGMWWLSQDGKLTGCLQPNDESTCPYEKNTKVPSWTMIGAGGVALAVGLMDLFDVFASKPKDETAARLIVGPQSVAIAGGF